MPSSTACLVGVLLAKDDLPIRTVHRPPSADAPLEGPSRASAQIWMGRQSSSKTTIGLSPAQPSTSARLRCPRHRRRDRLGVVNLRRKHSPAIAGAKAGFSRPPTGSKRISDFPGKRRRVEIMNSLI
jgi:hypothetical protein